MAEVNENVDSQPMSQEQFLEEFLRENERLRRQLADMQHERDLYKKFYSSEAAKNDLLGPQH